MAPISPLLLALLLFIQCTAAASNSNRIAFVANSAHLPHRERRQQQSSQTKLFSSLKPAATPLMDSGKALARSGELLIDLTTQLSLYGGSLSATGACIRNAGDCIAQAAASCRFKTATELVIDELRESADCLREGVDKLTRAEEESDVDGDERLRGVICDMIPHLTSVALCLEEGGRSILDRKAVDITGGHLVEAGEALGNLALAVEMLGSKDEGSEQNALLSSQRMVYASQQMVLAGRELRAGAGDEKKAVKGKAWLKG